MGVLTMIRVELGPYRFQLRWTGAAMFEWTDSEYSNEDITVGNPKAVAEMLHLMGREAAAFCRVYGYPALDPPDHQELAGYLRYAEMWELNYAVNQLSAALNHSNNRDYVPDDSVDVDTLELKKN